MSSCMSLAYTVCFILLQFLDCFAYLFQAWKGIRSWQSPALSQQVRQHNGITCSTCMQVDTNQAALAAVQIGPVPHTCSLCACGHQNGTACSRWTVMGGTSVEESALHDVLHLTSPDRCGLLLLSLILMHRSSDERLHSTGLRARHQVHDTEPTRWNRGI